MPWWPVPADAETVVLALLGVSAIVAALLQGHRIDRYIRRNFPALAARMPTDLGAWVGLAVGVSLVTAGLL